MASNDIIITVGSDPKSAKRGLDVVQKELHETAEVARSASTEVAASAVAINKMSNAAQQSAGLNRFTDAVNRNRFQVNLATSGFEDFFAVLGPAGPGAAVRAAANNFNTLFASINPIAGIVSTLAFTGLPLLISAFGSLNSEVEKTPEKVRDAVSELEKISDRVDTLNEKLTQGFASASARFRTDEFQEVLRQSNQSSANLGGREFSPRAFAIGIAQELGKGDKSLDRLTDTEIEARIEKALELMDKASSGNILAQELLTASFNRLLRRIEDADGGRGQVLFDLQRDAAEIIKQARSEVESRKQVQEAREEAEKIRKRQVDAERRIKDREAKQKEEATAVESLIKQVEKTYSDLLKRDPDPANARGSLQKALEFDGVDTKVIKQVLDRLEGKILTGIEGLNKELKDARDHAIAESVAIRKRAADEAKRRKEEDQKIQKVLSDNLSEAVMLLEHLNGNEALTRKTLSQSLQKNKFQKAEADLIADALVKRAEAQRKAEEDADRIAQGVQNANRNEGFGDRVRRNRFQAQKEKGRQLTPKELQQLKRETAEQFKAEQQAEREALDKEINDRRERFENDRGRKATAAEGRRMEQDARKAQRALDRNQRGVSPGSQNPEQQRIPGPAEMTQQVQQFIKGQETTIEELLQNQAVFVDQLGRAVRVSTQQRAAARNIRQSLPGPGARR